MIETVILVPNSILDAELKYLFYLNNRINII